MERLIPVLDPRLALIAAQVRPGRVVADIGADHGYLVTYLVASGICPRGIAADIHKLPLARAAATAREYGVAEQINLVQCDGLSALRPQDADDIVIAGMGFDTIKTILEAHPEKIVSGRKFVIQANTDVEGLRRWISHKQYRIIQEFIVKEQQHFYQMITFTNDFDSELSEEEIRFGRKMKKDFAFYSLWKYRLSKYEHVLNTLVKEHPKYNEMIREMFYIYKEFGSV